MRLPRFTTRRLMVLVAIVAPLLTIGAGLQRRKARFERLSSYHQGLTGPWSEDSFADAPGATFHTAKGRWHRDLSVKYGDAARYPWLPFPPDPPPPE